MCVFSSQHLRTNEAIVVAMREERAFSRRNLPRRIQSTREKTLAVTASISAVSALVRGLILLPLIQLPLIAAHPAVTSSVFDLLKKYF